MKKLKVVELFSGIGSQKKALHNINANYEVVGISEWDVNSIISYDAMHTDDANDYTVDMTKEQILDILNKYTFSTYGKKPCNLKRMNIKKLKQLYNSHYRSKNLGDITKIDSILDCDLLTYSYPCQSVSVAGKMKGFEKGSGTTSSLLWEVERLLLKAKENNNLPRYLLMENVKNLVSEKFIDGYKEWLKVLDNLGYNTYYQVLNAKNYGVPQNRERVFGISILKEYDNGYEFPKPFDSGLRLKDILEDKVDEKYYIDSERAKKLLSELDFSKLYKKCADMSINDPKFKDISNRKSVGCCVVESNDIVQVDIPQTVKVRKYDVDIENLKITLQQHKKQSKLTNKQISEMLNIKITTVEHWFRNDKCFSIPESEIWMKLKELFKIETIEFDKSIMEFEEKQGIYEKSERHYLDSGIAPTLTTSDNHKIICEERSDEGLRFFKDNVCGTLRAIDYCGDKRVSEETNTLKRLGNIYGDNFGTGYAGNVWDKEYICPTLTTSQGGSREPHILEETNKLIQSHTLEGDKWDKINESCRRIYSNEGISPTIHTCQGGNTEPKVAISCITPDRLEKRQNGRRFKEDGDPMFTLTGQDRHGVLENQYRIRKLTPTECFVLMNFTKEDINKCMAKGVSDSQLYKQAGNSICVNVLEEIFKQLLKNTEYLNN